MAFLRALEVFALAQAVAGTYCKGREGQCLRYTTKSDGTCTRCAGGTSGSRAARQVGALRNVANARPQRAGCDSASTRVTSTHPRRCHHQTRGQDPLASSASVRGQAANTDLPCSPSSGSPRASGLASRTSNSPESSTLARSTESDAFLGANKESPLALKVEARMIRVTFTSEETNKPNHGYSFRVDRDNDACVVEKVPATSSFAGLQKGDIIVKVINAKDHTMHGEYVEKESISVSAAELRQSLNDEFAQAFEKATTNLDLASSDKVQKSNIDKIWDFVNGEDLKCVFDPEEDSSEIFLLVKRASEDQKCGKTPGTLKNGFFKYFLFGGLPFCLLPSLFYSCFMGLRFWGVCFVGIALVAWAGISVLGLIFFKEKGALYVPTEDDKKDPIDYTDTTNTSGLLQTRPLLPIENSALIEHVVLLVAVVLALSFTCANMAFKFEKGGLTGDATAITFGIAWAVMVGMICKGVRTKLVLGLNWFKDQIMFFLLEEITLIGTTIVCILLLNRCEVEFKATSACRAWGLLLIICVVAGLKVAMVKLVYTYYTAGPKAVFSWKLFELPKNETANQTVADLKKKKKGVPNGPLSHFSKVIALIFFFGLHIGCDVVQEYVTSISTETGVRRLMTSFDETEGEGVCASRSSVLSCVSRGFTSSLDFAWHEVFIIPLLDTRSNLCCENMTVKRAVARDVAIQMLRRLYF